MERSRYLKLMTITRKNTVKVYFFSIEFYQYSRMQLGLDPLQLAVLPDRTQFLVAVPPVSRYPEEQEKVQWDPAAFLELVQEMLPCAGADRDDGQVATRWKIITYSRCHYFHN